MTQKPVIRCAMKRGRAQMQAFAVKRVTLPSEVSSASTSTPPGTASMRVTR